MSIRDLRDLPFQVEAEVIDLHLRDIGTAISEYLVILRHAVKGEMPTTAELAELTGHSRNTVTQNCFLLEDHDLIVVERTPGQPNRYGLPHAPKERNPNPEKKSRKPATKPDAPGDDTQVPSSPGALIKQKGAILRDALSPNLFRTCMKEITRKGVDRKKWLEIDLERLCDLIREAKEKGGQRPTTYLIKLLDQEVSEANQTVVESPGNRRSSEYS